jgi:hypothetical protein
VQTCNNIFCCHGDTNFNVKKVIYLNLVGLLLLLMKDVPPKQKHRRYATSGHANVQQIWCCGIHHVRRSAHPTKRKDLLSLLACVSCLQHVSRSSHNFVDAASRNSGWRVAQHIQSCNRIITQPTNYVGSILVQSTVTRSVKDIPSVSGTRMLTRAYLWALSRATQSCPRNHSLRHKIRKLCNITLLDLPSRSVFRKLWSVVRSII